jgi:hypothetical protein
MLMHISGVVLLCIDIVPVDGSAFIRILFDAVVLSLQYALYCSSAGK